MRLKNLKFQNPGNQRQRGAVLVIGLIMVLLITIIGLSAVRSSGLQESMAGNMRDRNIAFQASESALREGEEILAPTNVNLPDFNGTDGLHPDLSLTPANSVWYFASADWMSNKVKKISNLPSVADQPVYLIEELIEDVGSGPAAEGSGFGVGDRQITGDLPPYRVSSRGVGATTDTEVILQSTYRRRFQ